ncbi:MAG: tetratricopeptide repeat protein [Algoriphagus sp.]|nr:tetratricopeptide repeat protein [Algoriphagus sp.]
MGNLDRLQLLLQFTKEEPENPFNWYALALEYSNSDQAKTAEIFDNLLKSHPEYLPTYYTSAQFFSEQIDLEKAKEIFEKGILLAGKLKEEKALKELKNAYQNFLFENDFD